MLAGHGGTACGDADWTLSGCPHLPRTLLISSCGRFGDAVRTKAPKVRTPSALERRRIAPSQRPKPSRALPTVETPFSAAVYTALCMHNRYPGEQPCPHLWLRSFGTGQSERLGHPIRMPRPGRLLKC
jgi:hypothetical protein